MRHWADLRPTGAAGVMLAVLAGAYEATQQLTAKAAMQVAVAHEVRAATTVAVDSAVAVREVLAPRASLPISQADCPPRPMRFVAGSPAARRLRVVRRYVGTVGSQPATALLVWQTLDSIEGSFYLHRRAIAYTLASAPARRGRLALTVFREYPAWEQRGSWHLAGQPGKALTGTWHDANGAHPVRLQESYAGAVHLALETLHLQGGPSWVPREDAPDCSFVPSVNYEFMRLLDPLAVPPKLRPLLSPALAARRRLVRASQEGDATANHHLHVKLNDFGLLSYASSYTADPRGGRPQYAIAGSPLVDLMGGTSWPVRRLFRPGYELPLRRLVARHLLHDGQFNDETWYWQQEQTKPLPADTAMSNSLWLLRDLAPRPQAYVFTSEGLELTYWHGSLVEYGGGSRHDVVLVPYRELRPLLRPGTPLARMLKARGL